ncbi:glycosyltransferase [Piscicoccus intestinalis]|uniref:glycosyltransferase n=1 Tax=Piscicoccus intestinalis TaxID=746033 RepID=UPI000838EC98|nr:glycosyltransferase [Piscicoccus intestinalis]
MTTRVFALAFAAEPGRGSEPGAGAEFARALAAVSRRDDCIVRLYTRSHRLGKLRAALDADVPGHRLEVVPVAIWAPLARRLQWQWARLSYVWWQRRATSRVQADLRDVPAKDRVVVHHVTFATVAVPTFERRIRRPDGSSPTFVFGPAGSSSMELPDNPGLRVRGIQLMRTAVGRYNLAGVDLAVAQTLDLVPVFLRLGAKNALACPNVVVDPPAGIEEVIRNPKRIINVGLLIPRKRQELALQAFALLEDRDLRMAIVGSGPLEDDLRRRCHELGLGPRVDFLGKLTPEDTLREIARSAVLLHTSRNEGATWVIAEAQTVGTVPVAPPRTGADSTIHLGGAGVVARDDSPQALADAVTEALRRPGTTTDMWRRERLPELLTQWYGLA